MKIFPNILFAAGLVFLAGCVDQYGRVRPPDPIGRAIFDVLDPAIPVYEPREYVVTRPIPAAPPPGYYERRTVVTSYSNPYWVRGYWGWRGNGWMWVPGRWVDRPRAGAMWVGGRYYARGSRYYWRSGYWR
jgi:hypothetical protein